MYPLHCPFWASWGPAVACQDADYWEQEAFPGYGRQGRHKQTMSALGMVCSASHWLFQVSGQNTYVHLLL